MGFAPLSRKDFPILILQIISVAIIASLFFVLHFSSTVNASSKDYDEQELQFKSGDILLNGTLLIPNGASPHPAIILIHGAGSHTREEYRLEAEAFAQSGIAAFIFDKRTIGYSADGIGETSRSFSLLADDVLAALHTLRSLDEIDSDKIGLWGLSEGAWVAPLVAERSNDVAFVITISASGVPPVQQTSWAMENEFRHQGITASSFIHAFNHTGLRLLVSAGFFAEATYNPIPPFEQLSQPLLAIWGVNDRIAPPTESYYAISDALNRGGHEHYTALFIPEANHDLRFSSNGFATSEQFAVGYTEAMMSWVHAVLKGETPRTNEVGFILQQNQASYKGVVSPAWYDFAWLQLGVFIVLVGIFTSYLGMSFILLFNRRNRKHFTTGIQRVASLRVASLLAALGLTSTLGFFGYFGIIMMTNLPGIVIAGRPLPWLILQVISLLVCLLTVLLFIIGKSTRPIQATAEKVRIRILLIGGILFIPWALYWNLLLP